MYAHNHVNHHIHVLVLTEVCPVHWGALSRPEGRTQPRSGGSHVQICGNRNVEEGGEETRRDGSLVPVSLPPNRERTGYTCSHMCTT